VGIDQGDESPPDGGFADTFTELMHEDG
jgi:hypothetical protein